mmetsp:Transcript_13694/g.18984  ORF Transcript_13694/g.18984 Transcript_13694/m.18984 type:complete len:86 (-) Transcript_13694:80-337(-)
MLHVILNCAVREFSSNESLGIKNSIFWVHGNLILSCISNQSFVISEGHIRWSGSVSLVIGNDFNSIILPDSDTAVSCSKIDSNCL